MPADDIDDIAAATYQALSDETLAALPRDRADRARAFRDAATEINRAGGPRADGAPPAHGAGATLEEWARRHGQWIASGEVDRLALVSNSTSEHEVFYREIDGRAVKRTWPGFFGQVPAPEDGRLGRRNATPAEYLLRMALQLAVFRGDLRLEGATASDKPSMIIGQPAGEASLVISQRWYEKQDSPGAPDIAARLRREGFLPAPRSYYGWYRSADGVVIVDAKPDNFVATPAGLVPLDLQMAVFTPEQLRRCGLAEDTNHPFSLKTPN